MQEFEPFKQKEVVPSSVQEIMAMKLHLSDEEFDKLSKSSSYAFVSEKVSEDAFLRGMRTITELPKEDRRSSVILNLFASMMNILDRDSMISNPNRELYIEGVRELYKKYYSKEPEWFPVSR